MSPLVIGSVTVGVILVLIIVLWFALAPSKPAVVYVQQQGLSPDQAAALNNAAIQSQLSGGSSTSTPIVNSSASMSTSAVSEITTPTCGASACNAAMRNMIITRNSAFGPASPYQNALPECANCSPAVSYAWRSGGLSYTKDGTNWVVCGNQQACYDAVKLPESFIGEAYIA